MTRQDQLYNKRYKNKYKNVKTEWFDSKKEYKRYLDLVILERSGAISELQKQVSFTLQEWFRYDWEAIRPIVYRTDFVYIKDGQLIAEDVKWMQTPEFKIKRKLFLKIYGDKYKLIIT